MALESANYIDELVITNPTASDPVSQGDDQLRLIKKVVKQSFPSVDAAVNAIHTSSSAPSTSIAAGLVWFDTSANLLKIRNEANDAWVTLPISVVTSNTVDIDGGTIDGATIGATSASTGKFSSVNIAGDGATVTGIKDEDNMASDSAVKLATQQSIKAYVDSQVTAQDLDITTDSGTIDIDLDSETLTVAGGAGLDTAASSTTVTVNVTDGGVTNAKLADMAANTVKVRNANSSGVPSDLAVTNTQIVIGDGTGFTAAALSGDATMTNAGAVSVTGIQGQAVSATAATNDQYLKYSSSANEWQKVDVLAPDRLTTKGDLLVYNTVDSETRLPVGTNKKVVTANSSATNGLDWQYVDGESIRLGSDAAGDIMYFNGSNYIRLAKGSASEVLKMNSGANAPEWAADTNTTYTAGDGLDLTGTTFSTDLKSAGGLAIDSTELTVDFTSDNSWTGSQRATAVTDNDGSYDMNGGQNFITTPSGNFTLTFTNITNGQSGFIKLINSGGHTVSLHSNSKGDANLATTVSTAGTYLLSYFSDGTDVWLTNSAIYA